MTPVRQADKIRTVPGEALCGWPIGWEPLVLRNVSVCNSFYLAKPGIYMKSHLKQASTAMHTFLEKTSPYLDLH